MMTSSRNTGRAPADDVDAVLGESGTPEDEKISKLEADLAKEKAKRRQEKFIFSAVWITAPSMAALVFCKIWVSSLLVGLLAMILLLANARRCEQQWAVLLLDKLLNRVARITGE